MTMVARSKNTLLSSGEKGSDIFNGLFITIIGGKIQTKTFFRVKDEKRCKYLWKCAVEHHTFFRLRSPAKNGKPKEGFFKLGSKFRYR